jgi:hypothetical protein
MRKTPLAAAAQAACLAQCRRVARLHTPAQPLSPKPGKEFLDVALPACKDPDDQKFLELARDCHADFLVTKDRDLLVFARRKYQYLPFLIVTPGQFAGAPSVA